MPGAAGAATITVGSGGDDAPAAADDGDCTLREAVEAAGANAAVDACTAGQAGSADTIRFSVGAVTLDEAGSNEDTNQNGDLDVAGGSSGVTVDGGTSRTAVDGNEIERVFDVVGGTVTFRNLVIRDGDSAAEGGGIRAAAGTQVLVAGSELTANAATAGGAIRNAGALTVTGSALAANVASDSGGGLSQQGGSLAMSGSQISDNSAQNGPGGGIDILGVPGALAIDDSTISGNDAGIAGGSERLGGGISARPALDATLVVTDSSIDGNTAYRQGGGIALQAGGALNLSRSRVVSNSVVNDATGSPVPPVSGGGLADLAPSASVTIADSQFTGNRTSAGADAGANNGGGARLAGATTISRTTFNGNSVSGGEAGRGPSGGGLYVQSGTTNLVNVTISSNLATTPGGDGGGLDTGAGSGAVMLFNVTSAGNDADDQGDGILAEGRTADLRASLIGDGCGGGSIVDSGGNVESGDTCGLSDGSSSAISVGPLLDNGGAQLGVPGALQPRLTRAIPIGSAALDHVTGGCVDQLGANLTTDGRGLARPLDGDGNGSSVCDSGAFERAALVPPPPPPPADPARCPRTTSCSGCGASSRRSTTTTRPTGTARDSTSTTADRRGPGAVVWRAQGPMGDRGWRRTR